MNKDLEEKLKNILRGYSAVSLLPDRELYLEVAVQHIQALFEQKPNIEEQKDYFRRSVWAWNYKNKNKYDADTIKDFIDLWTRLENGQLKFQNEKVFKIGGRLATFSKHSKVFKESKELAKYKRAVGRVNPLR